MQLKFNDRARQHASKPCEKADGLAHASAQQFYIQVIIGSISKVNLIWLAIHQLSNVDTVSL